MQNASPLRLLAASAPGNFPPAYTATGRALRWLGFTARAVVTVAGWLLSIVLCAAALIVGAVAALAAVFTLAALGLAGLLAVVCPLLLWQLGKAVLNQTRLTAANTP